MTSWDALDATLVASLVIVIYKWFIITDKNGTEHISHIFECHIDLASIQYINYSTLNIV